MGYSMRQLESSVFIHHTDFRNVKDAINTLMEESSEQMFGHFMWVDTASVINAVNVTEQLTEWLWRPRYDSYGNIVDLVFQGEKSGDEDKLFKAIAPYVKADSYITMLGAEGETWQWRFTGTDCEEVDISAES